MPTKNKKKTTQKLPHFKLPKDPGPGPADLELAYERQTGKLYPKKFTVGQIVSIRQKSFEIVSVDTGTYTIVDRLTYQPDIVNKGWLESKAK
jgi:hypothetical protein